MADARREVLVRLLIAGGITLSGPAQAIGPGTTSRNDFGTEAEAARHCAGRPVVWVVPANHVYYFQGDPEYGHGQHGAFMCEDEASGDRNRPAGGKLEVPQ